MRTGLDFKPPQFDQIRGEAEDCVKMRGVETTSHSGPVRIGGFDISYE
jgi:hypothetical protein